MVQTPLEQALTSMLQEQFNQNVQLRVAIVQLQQQIADLDKPKEEANG